MVKITLKASWTPKAKRRREIPINGELLAPFSSKKLNLRAGRELKRRSVNYTIVISGGPEFYFIDKTSGHNSAVEY